MKEEEEYFDFDLELMKKAVEGPTIIIPPGLSRSDRQEWIKNRLKELGGEDGDFDCV